MRYVCTAAATVKPVSVADIHAAIGVASAADDSYISGLIDTAIAAVEARLNRQFCTATWSLYLDEFPAEIVIEKIPVATIASINYVNLAGTTTAFTDYQTDRVSPDHPARIMPAYGYSWPQVRADTYNPVIVSFTAGYGVTAASVPIMFRNLIKLIVAHWYENREAVGSATLQTVPMSAEWLNSLCETGAYG